VEHAGRETEKPYFGWLSTELALYPKSTTRILTPCLDDPESTADLVERFSRDRDEEVRHRAATDPRLTPESAVRLVDDSHERVRHAAARHPSLPAQVLIRLLRDADTAQTAARYPALPTPVMEQMLQWIQPPPSATSGP
jgi:hypothetical protein